MPKVEFPEANLELGQHQIEMLVEKGVIRRRPSGGFIGLNSEVALAALADEPQLMICDFCSGGPVRYEYPATDFTVINVTDDAGTETHNSLGSWMACKACAEFIEEDDLDGLQKRAMTLLMAKHDIGSAQEAAAVGVAVGASHSLFWQHRSGPRKRI